MREAFSVKGGCHEESASDDLLFFGLEAVSSFSLLCHGIVNSLNEMAITLINL